ncbi:MAG TPA: alginate export family protein [Verrucomicrobiae bacterium]|nr:alginate export family protein [Verrucomicrobiae bacterium]
MKTMKSSIATGALVLAALNDVYAQYTPPPPPAPFPGFLNEYLRQKDPYMAAWDFSSTVRMRYEVKENGLGLPPANDFRDETVAGGLNDNSYFSQKILMRIGYTHQWWSAFVEGRSSGTTGDRRGDTGAPPVPGPGTGPESDGPIDLHQAYVTVGNHKEFPLSLKVGRQELSYGDERLVGAFAWNNIGRVFDAIKVRAQTPWFAAEAFTSKLVLPDDNEFNVWNDYSLFSGLHLSSKLIPKNTAEAYFFARNDDIGSSFANPDAVLPFQTAAPVSRDIYTLGARFKSNPGEFGNFDYTVEGAYQFGNWQQTLTSDNLDHEAFAVVANLGYTFAECAATPRLALEYAFGSGDSDPNDGRHETFDNLFPTNHKFYGYMDFFSWQNLHDVRAILSIKPLPRLSLAVEGHLFWLADTRDNLYNAGGVARGGGPNSGGFGRNAEYSSFIGSEIDIVAGYALTRFASLEAGYGHFFTGDYIDSTWAGAGGSADADWVYVQTVIRF